MAIVNTFRAVLVAGLFSCTALNAQDWTLSVEVSKADNGRSHRAFLWIPPEASEHVRGIILSAQTSSELRFSTDPLIRQVAAQQKLAIVFFHPSTVSLPDANGANLVQQTLKTLASESGYPEIEHAPWITFGHSTSSHFALKMAYWKPGRSLGVIVHKGGLVPPAGWEGNDLAGIPTLVFQGQYEEFPIKGGDHGTTESIAMVSADVLALRAKDPERYLVGPFITPGEGHMAFSYRNASLLAMFIRKVCERRLPQNAVARSGPVTLNAIDGKSGWLGDTDLLGDVAKISVDTFPTFPDAKSKFWFIDREFAQAWLQAEQGLKKDRQTLGTASDKPKFDPAVNVSWSSGSRTYTCKLQNGASHAITATTNKGLKAVTMVQAGPGYVKDGKLHVDPCLTPDDNTIRIILHSDGNATLGSVDRMIRATVENRTGTAQSITLPGLPANLNVGADVNLDAKASSGLPVRYRVISGPGRLENGNRLVATPFTARSGKARIHLRACQEGGGSFATAEVKSIDIPVTGTGSSHLISLPTDRNFRNGPLKPAKFQNGKMLFQLGLENSRLLTGRQVDSKP